MISISTASSAYSGKLSFHRLIFEPAGVWDLSRVNPTFFCPSCHPEVLWVRKSLLTPSISQTRPAGRCKIRLGWGGSGMGVPIHSRGPDLHVGIGVMDTGKWDVLGASLLPAEKGISLWSSSFPPALASYLLMQRKSRCDRKREGGFLRIWGFFVSKTTLFLLKPGKLSTPKGFAAGCWPGQLQLSAGAQQPP